MTFGTAVYWYNGTVATPCPQFTSSFSPILAKAQQDGTVMLCISFIQGLGVHKMNINVSLSWPAFCHILYRIFICKSSVRFCESALYNTDRDCYLPSGCEQIYAHDATYKKAFTIKFIILCCPVDANTDSEMCNLFQVHFSPLPQQCRQHLPTDSAV